MLIRSRKVRAACAVLLAAGLVVGLSACNRGGSGSGGDSIVIGLVPKTLQNPVWQGVIAGAKEEASKLGNVTIKADAPQNEEDIQGQISKIQDLISGGANELIVAPDGDALKPVLQQAASKGIHVVLIDTDIASFSQKTSYVSSVQDTSSADVVGVSIKALGSAAKGAEVGILDFPGNNTVQARVDAAKKAYEAAGMKVVAQLPGKCDRATALNATTDMLQAHPNIKAIFGGCGQGATGAALAARNASKQVSITGFDGITGEFEDIKDGQMVATVLQDFPAIGARAVNAAVDAHNKKSVEKSYLIPGIIITKSNVSKYKPAG